MCARNVDCLYVATKAPLLRLNLENVAELVQAEAVSCLHVVSHESGFGREFCCPDDDMVNEPAALDPRKSLLKLKPIPIVVREPPDAVMRSGSGDRAVGISREAHRD